jgi:hypothetical protein
MLNVFLRDKIIKNLRKKQLERKKKDIKNLSTLKLIINSINRKMSLNKTTKEHSETKLNEIRKLDLLRQRLQNAVYGDHGNHANNNIINNDPLDELIFSLHDKAVMFFK